MDTRHGQSSKQPRAPTTPEVTRMIGDQNSSDNGKSKALTVAALADAKRLPAQFLRNLGLHDLPGEGVGVTYHDPTGEVLFVRTRTALAAKNGTRQPKGKPLSIYGLWKLDQANRAGFVILVE